MKEFVEKLIERLEEEKTRYREIRKNTYCRRTEMDDCDSCRADHYLDARLEGINKAKEIVNQLAEEYVPETNVGKWIPCSERLPEEAEAVFLTFRNSTGTFVEMATFIRGKFYYISDADGNYYEGEFKKPIAWQPLPEPYKPEQQKEIPTNHFTERFNRVM